MARTILAIDDERSILESLKGALGDEGYRVLTASSGKEGLALLQSERPDVILLDIWMTEMDGIETLQEIKKEWPAQNVIMMSGHGTIETAVKATKYGAYDFVEKPLSLEKILVLIKNAIRSEDLSRENSALRDRVERQTSLIGETPPIRQIKDLVKRVAPTTGSVLITGENGTGKELVAQSIHFMSPRFNKPFVIVNCAAIPEELIESELFGHERGAFTGAVQQRKGKFDLAHTGTLFLDEIADMSLKTQAKVLRIIQEQKFERVGGTQTISVDVRLVAATNKDLKTEIKEGRFREDLFYRLNVIPFVMPPLRDRKDDIPVLSAHFLNHSCVAHDRKSRLVTPEAMEVLKNYPWPGNVRELKNFIERLVILTSEADDGKPILAAHLLEHLEGEVVGESTLANLKSAAVLKTKGSLKDARQEFEKEFILKTLKENDWNISKTAMVLGVERSHLSKKIKSLGIDLSSEG